MEILDFPSIDEVEKDYTIIKNNKAFDFILDEIIREFFGSKVKRVRGNDFQSLHYIIEDYLEMGKLIIHAIPTEQYDVILEIEFIGYGEFRKEELFSYFLEEEILNFYNNSGNLANEYSLQELRNM